MISIRKASEDLDRLEELQKIIGAMRTSYTHALESAAHYAVELDAGDSKLFREHLDQIRALAEKAASAEEWASIQASLRGELREHRDRSVAQLAKLRAEIKTAAEAMELFANSVASSGADHKEALQQAVGKLNSVAREGSLGTVRRALAETGAQITATVEQMERAHHLVIAQLRDEIRSLHQKMDADRRAQFLDPATGVWNRPKLDSQLRQLLDQDESFCVLVLTVRTLKRPDQTCSQTLIDDGIRALLQRLSAMLGKHAFLCRWNEETFAAILQIEPAAAISLSREATQRLSGSYSVQENGMSRCIDLRAAAGVIDHQRGTETASFHDKLLQMSEALRHA